MKTKEKILHCSDYLLQSFQQEVSEVRQVIDSIKWASDFELSSGDKNYQHQTAYNRAFKDAFTSLNWETQPKLSDKPKLIGDFKKHLVFIEIQFGNSATLYRDFYKFQ